MYAKIVEWKISYKAATEYIDFHGNKYKIVKKSVYIYERKCHLENVLFENKITSSHHEKLKYVTFSKY